MIAKFYLEIYKTTLLKDDRDGERLEKKSVEKIILFLYFFGVIIDYPIQLIRLLTYNFKSD